MISFKLHHTLDHALQPNYTTSKPSPLPPSPRAHSPSWTHPNTLHIASIQVPNTLAGVCGPKATNRERGAYLYCI